MSGTDDGAPPEAGVQPEAGFRRVGRGPARRTRWDRPPEPRDWRFFVGWLGRTLIALGVLVFLFVAYQLWGTGLETARAQGRLEDEFATLVADVSDRPSTTTAPATAPPPTVPETTVATTPGSTLPDATVPASTVPATAPATTAPEVVPVDEQFVPDLEHGDPFARLVIPRIGLDMIVVPGVGHDDLKLGPGYFLDTPLPGRLGNTAIAGHRTTYKAPFGDLDEMVPGDDIEITMLDGQRFVYVVTGAEVVAPSEYRVISDFDPTKATLTLITCTPKTTSSHRLVVYAELDPARSGAVGEAAYLDLEDEPTDTLPGDAPDATSPVSGDVPGDSVPGETPGSVPTPSDPAPDGPAAPDRQPTDAFSGGWFSDSTAWPHIVLWGLALAAVGVGGWWLARFYKREWLGCLAAFVPFVVCLYFFYQNVNRLLPPGL